MGVHLQAGQRWTLCGWTVSGWGGLHRCLMMDAHIAVVGQCSTCSEGLVWVVVAERGREDELRPLPGRMAQTGRRLVLLVLCRSPRAVHKLTLARVSVLWDLPWPIASA